MSDARALETTLDGGAVQGFQLTSPDGRLTVDVAPQDGGGLGSLRLGKRELLYRADTFGPPPPGEWMGRAPLLWPAVGRNFTAAALRADHPECCFELDGTVYNLPIHGFTRHKVWTPVETGSDDQAAWVVVSLADDDETRRVYPFDFQLQTTHRVENGAVESTVLIQSSGELPFGIGNHLTVNLPAPPKFAEAVLKGTPTKRLLLDPNSLLNGESEPIELTDGLPLSDPRLLNAVLGGIEGEPRLELTWPDGLTMTVSQRVGAGATHVRDEDWLFVLYGNESKRYFCPEPWIGRPNGLQTGDGIVRLPAGERFEWTMRLEFGE